MSVAATAKTATPRAAASGARGSGNIDDLARKLAKNEQDPDKLTEAMHGLGYSKTEARAAAHKATGGAAGQQSGPSGPRPSSWATTRAKRNASRPAGNPSSTPRPDPEGAASGESLPGKQGKPVGFTDTPAKPAYRLPSAGGSGSGVLIALVLYPAGLAFLRGGPAGLKAWFGAKFFNKVPGSAA